MRNRWLTKDELKKHYEDAAKKMGSDMIDAITYMTNLPSGDGQLSLWDWNKVADEIATVNEDVSCKHEWVNVGFHFDKWVCKKCDVNKGSNK